MDLMSGDQIAGICLFVMDILLPKVVSFYSATV